jgi:serine/threonine protein phosphatase PrpC
LWDVLTAEEALRLAYAALQENDDPDAAARVLAQTALERGSQDNITACLITFKHFSRPQ